MELSSSGRAWDRVRGYRRTGSLAGLTQCCVRGLPGGVLGVMDGRFCCRQWSPKGGLGEHVGMKFDDPSTWGELASWVVPALTFITGVVVTRFKRNSPVNKALAHLNMAELYESARMPAEKVDAMRRARAVLLRTQVREKRRSAGVLKFVSNLDALMCLALIFVLCFSFVTFFFAQGGDVSQTAARWCLLGTVVAVICVLVTGVLERVQEERDVEAAKDNLPPLTASGTVRHDRGDATAE